MQAATATTRFSAKLNHRTANGKVFKGTVLVTIDDSTCDLTSLSNNFCLEDFIKVDELPAFNIFDFPDTAGPAKHRSTNNSADHRPRIGLHWHRWPTWTGSDHWWREYLEFCRFPRRSIGRRWQRVCANTPSCVVSWCQSKQKRWNNLTERRRRSCKDIKNKIYGPRFYQTTSQE